MRKALPRALCPPGLSGYAVPSETPHPYLSQQFQHTRAGVRGRRSRLNTELPAFTLIPAFCLRGPPSREKEQKRLLTSPHQTTFTNASITNTTALKIDHLGTITTLPDSRRCIGFGTGIILPDCLGLIGTGWRFPDFGRTNFAILHTAR